MSKVIDFETGGLKMALVMILNAMKARKASSIKGDINYDGSVWSVSIKKKKEV